MGVIQTHSAACGAVLIPFPLIDPHEDVNPEQLVIDLTDFSTLQPADVIYRK